MSQKVRIGDKLVESGYISNEQLERAYPYKEVQEKESERH